MVINIQFEGTVRKIGNSNYVNVPIGLAKMLGKKEYVFRVEEKKGEKNECEKECEID